MKLTGRFFAAAALAVSATCGATTTLVPVESGDLPAAAPGTLRRYTARCAALAADFTVDVWFPEGYAPGGDTRYPGVYILPDRTLLVP